MITSEAEPVVCLVLIFLILSVMLASLLAETASEEKLACRVVAEAPVARILRLLRFPLPGLVQQRAPAPAPAPGKRHNRVAFGLWPQANAHCVGHSDLPSSI